MGDALTGRGAFYLRGHGLDEAVLAGAFAAGARLRDLADDRKQPVEVGVNGLARGWHRVPATGPRRYETYEVGLELPTQPAAPGDVAGALHGPNLWPDLPGFREPVYRCFQAMLDLSRRLLGPVAAGLGLDARYLPDRATRPVTLLRIMTYEARGAGDDQLRIVPHTDFELFTVIAETSPGFELCDRDGRWQQAEALLPGGLLVLAGDLLEVVTAGRVESPLHRVRAADRPRQSLVFFFGLDADATVSPQVPPAASREGAYRPVVVGHHLARQILSCPRLRARHVAGDLLPDLPLRAGNPYKAWKMERLVDERAPA